MSRLALATFAALLIAAPAAAQEIDPETGEVYIPPESETAPAEEEAPPPVDTTSRPNSQPASQRQPREQPAWYNGGPTSEEPPPVQESPPMATTGEASSSGDADGPDDHERVIGRLAVGFMGASTVPIGTPGGTRDTVTAPALGIRYWLAELVGLDVGIGIGYIGGTTSVAGMSTPSNNAFAMTIHAGLPLALFHEEHYKFLIIPELNFGFATGTAFGGSMDQDQGRDGLLFQVGGRVGTEIHFGFMDVPQLSLQASVGLYFEYTSSGVGTSTAMAPEENMTNFGLGTSVQGEPWDIILGALNALYYF